MKRRAKIKHAIAFAVLFVFGMFNTAIAGSVTYTEGADKFVVIDNYGAGLFNDFEGARAGSTIEQKVTLSNDVAEDCAVKIFLRLETDDKELESCLKGAELKIKGEEGAVENTSFAYMGGIGDDVLIGTCGFDKRQDIHLTLTLPEDINEDQLEKMKKAGWVITAEQVPLEPIEAYFEQETGPNYTWIYICGGVAIAIGIAIVIVLRSKRRKRVKFHSL